MREKIWPIIARLTPTKKVTLKNLIDDLKKTFFKNAVIEEIIQNTNEISKNAAADLWCRLESNEIQTSEENNRADVQSYKNLMETLSSSISNDRSQVLFVHLIEDFLFEMIYLELGDNEKQLCRFYVFFCKNKCQFHRRVFEYS